jgi:hypothetical protein
MSKFGGTWAQPDTAPRLQNGRRVVPRLRGPLHRPEIRRRIESPATVRTLLRPGTGALRFPALGNVSIHIHRPCGRSAQSRPEAGAPPNSQSGRCGDARGTGNGRPSNIFVFRRPIVIGFFASPRRSPINVWQFMLKLRDERRNVSRSTVRRAHPGRGGGPPRTGGRRLPRVAGFMVTFFGRSQCFRPPSSPVRAHSLRLVRSGGIRVPSEKSYVRPHPGLLPQEKGNCRPPQATPMASNWFHEPGALRLFAQGLRRSALTDPRRIYASINGM